MTETQIEEIDQIRTGDKINERVMTDGGVDREAPETMGYNVGRSMGAVVAQEIKDRDICIRAEHPMKPSLLIRYHIEGNHGEWRKLQIGSATLDGEILVESEVVDLIDEWAINFLDPSKACVKGTVGESEMSAWQKANIQDVFRSYDRCEGCGESERHNDLTAYKTVYSGEKTFCESCRSEIDDESVIAKLSG